MSSLIPTGRQVIGEDLDALREQLGISTMDACWVYGMSMTKWTNSVKKGARTPLSNATLSLLARTLAEHPELCPLPQTPSAARILEMIRVRNDRTDKKRLALMFGCEASSGYRWVTLDSRVSPVVSRLFLVFETLYLEAAGRSNSALDRMLQRWDQAVQEEAASRGVRDVYLSGRWETEDAPDARVRPVNGEDLDELRELLGLSTMDACWLFGMSMTKWMKVVNKAGQEPVSNASLGLLVRVLRDFPDASPLPRTVSAAEVFEEINRTKTIDKKRLAIMFGSEASSGYRWITVRSKISPVVSRLFMVFLAYYMQSRKRSSTKKVLLEWEQMVSIEAASRGISNVFSGGRWTQNEDDTDGKDSSEEKAPRKRRKSAQTTDLFGASA